MSKARIAAWTCVLLAGTLAIWGLVKGVRETGGASVQQRFDCDRAAGECRTYFPARTLHYPLANIVGVTLGDTTVSLGRGGSVEHQQRIVLKMKNGEDAVISESTADHASLDGYRAQIPQIQAFLDGKAPVLALTFASQQSHGVAVNDVMGALLILFLVALAAAFLLSTGEKKPAVDA